MVWRTGQSHTQPPWSTLTFAACANHHYKAGSARYSSQSTDQTTGETKRGLTGTTTTASPTSTARSRKFLSLLSRRLDRCTEEASHDYLLQTHVTNVASRTTYALAEANAAVIQNVLNNIKQVVFAIRRLHEHAHTVHGIKDLVLAQNRDVQILALKKLVNNQNIDQNMFPEDVCAFARNHFKQKKELLFLNSNGVLCARYPPSQRLLHERPCMIVMPQLYQHEICFRVHDAMGHQGISNVFARIQERHTWRGNRRTVGQ